MIVSYDIYTQSLQHARQIAMQRAAAEGWKSATILNLVKVGYDVYSVTLTVHK